jgi:uncharacterized protein
MIKAHPEGCVLAVRAQPGARRIGIHGVFRDALKIAVSAPPEDGRANAAICEVIQKALGLKRSQIELISGQTSREKRILIRGISVADLERLLAPCLN